MTTLQVAQGGIVINAVVVPSDAVVSSDGSSATWSDGQYEAPQGTTLIEQDGASIGWVLSGSVLVAPAPPAATPPTQTELLTYANAKQWTLATGGYTVTVNGASIVFPTDPVSMELITGKAARLDRPNPPSSFKWQTPTGFVTIAATAFDAVATQIADFVQSTFDALDPVEAAIEAGMLMTTAAIDDASWPSNVSTTPA